MNSNDTHYTRIMWAKIGSGMNGKMGKNETEMEEMKTDIRMNYKWGIVWNMEWLRWWKLNWKKKKKKKEKKTSKFYMKIRWGSTLMHTGTQI